MLIVLFAVGSVAHAAEPDKPSDKADASPIKTLTVPAVFKKSVPESINDARQIEEHVTKLIDRCRKATVALRVGRAYGTGVIVSKDGLILTAGHVISRPGRDVDVTLWDGTRVKGETLGRNRSLDSGMIELPKDRDWPYAELAPDELPYPGTWCLALGHPGGYDGKRGVVARLGRTIISRKRFLQTDCELVGGDSGGPLFDMSGKVLAIHSRIGEATNYNFHVPVAVYREEWDRLRSGEDFAGHSGALLGLTGVPNTGGLGMKVTKVFPGEPAEKAGVQVGDILVLFQSKEVRNVERLTELV
ncbi:MAG TPA: trypsin-like peptidase domain-containing protein, partial [Caulifigura sp.]|nr:trypsin-like peptidase domain-containing protein [Caulifigura sp.]